MTAKDRPAAMKFIERRHFANADVAARKLVGIANGIETIQDSRIYIERVNAPFLAVGGSGEDFRHPDLLHRLPLLTFDRDQPRAE
jgi:hypothetical protein